jgi:hypothetical protein
MSRSNVRFGTLLALLAEHFLETGCGGRRVDRGITCPYTHRRLTAVGAGKVPDSLIFNNVDLPDPVHDPNTCALLVRSWPRNIKGSATIRHCSKRDVAQFKPPPFIFFRSLGVRRIRLGCLIQKRLQIPPLPQVLLTLDQRAQRRCKTSVGQSVNVDRFTTAMIVAVDD